MSLIEVWARVSETPAGLKCLITQERILMASVAPHARFVQSAEATIERVSQPIACDEQETKAIKG